MVAINGVYTKARVGEGVRCDTATNIGHTDRSCSVAKVVEHLILIFVSVAMELPCDGALVSMVNKKVLLTSSLTTSCSCGWT